MITKLADAKGRISLGSRFANKAVIIEEVDSTEVRVIVASVIPERETWLQKNNAAMASVQRGLAQAKAGKFAKNPPNVDDDERFAASLED